MDCLRHKFTLLLYAFFLTCCALAYADLSDAERLYSEGKFQDSRDLYRANYTNGEWKNLPNPAPFFYNWALAEWKAGDKAYAIAAITAAKMAKGSDRDINDNYEWMKGQLDPSAKNIAPTYQPFANLLAIDFVTSAGLALAGAVLFLAGAFIVWQNARFNWGANLCLFLATLILIGALSLRTREHTTLAVLKGNTSLHSGPGGNFAVIDTLPLGSLVAVSDRSAGFNQLSYHRADNKDSVAWAAEQDIILLPPGL